MKPFLAACLVVASALLTRPAAAQAGQKPSTVGKPARYGIALAPGDPVPNFAGSDLGGKLLDVAYDGRAATVVGFWSSTCIPCRIQSPALQKLFVQHGRAGLQVVGVNVDSDPVRAAPTAALAFLEEHGGTYPVMRSTPEIEAAWRGVTVLPMTFLVGRDGKLLRRYIGADEAGMKGLLDDVAAYLAGRPLGDQPFPASAADALPPAPAGAEVPQR